ncbi:hypothetical protein JTB14_037824 [Gonioctena quinquepunctata]|nr:hypothetical protein JTB14_037824 [Gonioctena quinquepunctata]
MFMVLAAAYADNPHELVDMSDPSIVPDLNLLRVILIIISVASALQCLFSILLIFGAETNRPALLKPWLVLNPIVLLTYIVSTLMAILHHTSENMMLFIVGHMLFGMIVTLIVCYQILCVWNFHKHLKSLNF